MLVVHYYFNLRHCKGHSLYLDPDSGILEISPSRTLTALTVHLSELRDSGGYRYLRSVANVTVNVQASGRIGFQSYKITAILQKLSLPRRPQKLVLVPCALL